MAEKQFLYPLPPEEPSAGLSPAQPPKKFTYPIPETYGGTGIQGPPMPPREPESVVMDVAKTVGTNVPKGFAAGTVGFPGDIGQIGMAGQEAYNEAVKRRLMAPSEERQMTPQSDVGREVAIGRERMMQDLRPKMQEAERVLGPTHYGLTNVLSEYMPSGADVMSYVNKIPFMNYEPQTETGKKFEHPSQVSGSVAGPGGLVRNVGRAVVAGGSSLLGGEAEQAIDDKGMLGWVKPYVQPIAEMAGMHFGPKIGGIIAPRLDAEKKIASAMREDRAMREAMPDTQVVTGAESRIPLTRNEAREAIAMNDRMTGLDVGGPNTRALLEESGSLSPSAAHDIQVYNINRQSRPIVARNEAVKFTKSLSDYPELGFDELDKANRLAQKAETDRLYSTAMQHPNAEAIPLSPQLNSEPVFNSAVERVTKDLENLKRKYGYENEAVTPPTPAGQPFTYFDANTGQMVSTASNGAPGNLAFYDILKKELWNLETRPPPNMDPNEFARIRRNLVNELDAATDGQYAAARNSHAEAVGANNAHEYGLLLGRRAGAIPNDEMREVLAGIDSYSPQEMALLQHGYLNGLVDQMNQQGGLQKLANEFVRGQNININARKILGDDMFHDLRGKVIYENLAAISPAVEKLPSKDFLKGVGTSGGIAAGITGAIGLASDYVFNALMSAQFSQALAEKTPFIVGAATVAGVSAGMSQIKARRIATEIAPLLLDPANAKRVSQLMDKDPMIAALMQTMVASQPVMQQYRESQMEQANGGRTMRASGGRTSSSPAKSKAAKLVALVEKHRKEQGDEMSPLLNLDDATVVKALAVANKAI